MKLELPSSITKIELDGRDFYIKRDDLVDPYLSGNKFRKLYALIKTPKQNLKRVISYGGTQSNAMLSIAYMCHKKGWEFTYYTKPISKTQEILSDGNYKKALEFGMKHIQVSLDEYKEYISSLRFNLDPFTFVVDQGGAIKEAKEGLKVLADEIKELSFSSLASPSGTGTTALFLATSLPKHKVYTIPCIGDEAYLRQELEALSPIPPNLSILKPKKKYHFAKPYVEFLEIYHKLLGLGVEFDLLYAPSLWLALLEQTDEDILYIHSGGVYGNTTMLARYTKKGIYV